MIKVSEDDFNMMKQTVAWLEATPSWIDLPEKVREDFTERCEEILGDAAGLAEGCLMGVSLTPAGLLVAFYTDADDNDVEVEIVAR